MMRAMMRAGGLLFAAGGLALVVLVGYYGVGTISLAVLDAGWSLPGVALINFLQLMLNGAAWRALMPPPSAQSLRVFVWVRWIREAVNNLLPVAQIGGEVVGARLLAVHGVPLALAGASAVVDFTVAMVAQILFALAGLGLLLIRPHDGRMTGWIGAALPVAILVVAGFVLAQRIGLWLLIERGLLWLARRWPRLSLGGIGGLHDGIRSIHANRRGLLRSVTHHSLAWLSGTAEVWLVLVALDHRVSLREALVIESLGLALRSTGFAVPGAVGVQEAGFIVTAAPFGVPPETAIALSMVKRLRDLAFGLPALLAWQWSEGLLTIPKVSAAWRRRNGG
jgi:putative membrane protein